MGVKALITACLAGTLVVLALASPALSGEEPTYLLPDLKPLRADDVRVSTEGGRKLLRFSTKVWNRGLGPLELRPAAEDCDGDGNSANDRLAYQQLFVDVDANNTFEREVDTPPDEAPAGCQHFHALHNHWHFDDFGVYKLLGYNARGVLKKKATARANKVSFCMVDSYRHSDRPDAPAAPYYMAQDGNECGADTFTGISVGWVDNYPSTLDGQSLPLGGAPNGLYCLRMRIDPSGLLQESREANNINGVRFRLRGSEVVMAAKPRCKS